MSAILLFQVVKSRFDALNPTRPTVILERDTWNDFGYVTQFRAYYAFMAQEFQYLGKVKILERGKLSPELSPTFLRLGDHHCSLGQSFDYYERLAELGGDQAREILVRLQDVVFTPRIAAEFRVDPGFLTSLVRDTAAEQALGEARSRFFEQNPMAPPEETPDLTFSCQIPGFDAPHVIRFTFSKGPERLGRMMALVGKNGTGKTRVLAALAKVLSGLDPTQGTIEQADQRHRVVVISFSAFDRFTRPLEADGSYSYYGLRRLAGEVVHSTISPADLPRRQREDVVDLHYAFFRLGRSLNEIRRRGEEEEVRWRDMVASTGFFGDQPHIQDPFQKGVAQFLDNLREAGSGHQMLIFVATAIIESVAPGTVILFDEPELHFHPNQLSTLLRLLYDALEKNDAYAIVATHSPIVVQEIPQRYLRIVRLEGRRPLIEEYGRESFGENLSEIVQYAFDVAEADKSYVTILRQLAKKLPREAVEALFDDELGLGARMVLRQAYRDKGTPE
jgi:putative AbiEii toxin of type IV toxin-antitoxin system